MASPFRWTATTIVGFVFVLAPLSCRSGTAERDTANDGLAADSAAAREVGEAIAGYLAALERSDAVAAADYWDADTRILAPGMDADREAIVNGIRAVFDGGTKIDILNRRTMELVVVGNAAFEIAQAEEVFLAPRSSRPDTVRNNIFVRWRKGSDGKWRFQRVVLGPQAASPSR